MNATHTVSMWLANDPGLYYGAQELAERVRDELGIDRDRAFREWVEEMVPESIEGMCRDLVMHALADVDWTEIADEYHAECEVEA